MNNRSMLQVCAAAAASQPFRRGDDTVGNPHRAQISQFELFEVFGLSGIRQAILYRAIRGSSMPTGRNRPPLLTLAPVLIKSPAARGRRPASPNGPRRRLASAAAPVE